jgi:hypothetical protein
MIFPCDIPPILLQSYPVFPPNINDNPLDDMFNPRARRSKVMLIFKDSKVETYCFAMLQLKSDSNEALTKIYGSKTSHTSLFIYRYQLVVISTL